jgi:hypothetical protein
MSSRNSSTGRTTQGISSGSTSAFSISTTM